MIRETGDHDHHNSAFQPLFTNVSERQRIGATENLGLASQSKQSKNWEQG